MFSLQKMGSNQAFKSSKIGLELVGFVEMDWILNTPASNRYATIRFHSNAYIYTPRDKYNKQRASKHLRLERGR